MGATPGDKGYDDSYLVGFNFLRERLVGLVVVVAAASRHRFGPHAELVLWVEDRSRGTGLLEGHQLTTLVYAVVKALAVGRVRHAAG